MAKHPPKEGGLVQAMDQLLRGKAVGDGEPVDPVEGALSTALAAAALIVAGRVSDLKAGVAKASQAIESGQARRALEQLIAITNDKPFIATAAS